MKGKRVLQWIVLTALLLSMSISVSAAEEPVIYNTYIEGNQLHLYVGKAADADGVSCQIGNTKCEDTTLETEIPIETYILTDNSLSIDEKYHETIHQILQKLAESISEQENITIATFDTELHYLIQNSTDLETLQQTIDGISYENQYTKVTDAMYTLCKDLENVPFDGLRRIILISDGTEDATVGYTRQELLDELEDLSYPVYTVGCTYKDNADNLEEMFSLSRLTDAEAFWLDEVSDTEAIVNAMNSCKSAARVRVSIPENLGDGASKGIKLDFQTEEGVKTVSMTVVMPFFEVNAQTETLMMGELESTEISTNETSETEEAVVTEFAAAAETGITEPVTEVESMVIESAAAAGTEIAESATEAVVTESAAAAETGIAEPATEAEAVVTESAAAVETEIAESVTEAETVAVESAAAAETVIAEPVTEAEAVAVESAAAVETVIAEVVTEAETVIAESLTEENPASMVSNIPTEIPATTEALTLETTAQGENASESEESTENAAVQESKEEEDDGDIENVKKVLLFIALFILLAVLLLRICKKRKNIGKHPKSEKPCEADTDVDDGVTRMKRKKNADTDVDDGVTRMKRKEKTGVRNGEDFDSDIRKTEYTDYTAYDSETGYYTTREKTQLMDGGAGNNVEDMPIDFVNIRLTDMRNPLRVTEFPLSESVLLGRGANVNQVLFEYDKSVSYTHCEIFRRNSRIYVRDLNSTNGTWVNDQKVEGEMELCSGAVLKMGRLELIFEIVESEG